MKPRPLDIYTLLWRHRASGSVFSDAYTETDAACESFADTDQLEYEFLGAFRTKLDHPAAPGTGADYDIRAEVDRWAEDHALEVAHIEIECRARRAAA